MAKKVSIVIRKEGDTHAVYANKNYIGHYVSFKRWMQGSPGRAETEHKIYISTDTEIGRKIIYKHIFDSFYGYSKDDVKDKLKLFLIDNIGLLN